jgi:hypothetical protein
MQGATGARSRRGTAVSVGEDVGAGQGAEHLRRRPSYRVDVSAVQTAGVELLDRSASTATHSSPCGDTTTRTTFSRWTTRSMTSTATRPEPAARRCSQARCRQELEHHLGGRPRPAAWIDAPHPPPAIVRADLSPMHVLLVGPSFVPTTSAALGAEPTKPSSRRPSSYVGVVSRLYCALGGQDDETNESGELHAIHIGRSCRISDPPSTWMTSSRSPQRRDGSTRQARGASRPRHGERGHPYRSARCMGTHQHCWRRRRCRRRDCSAVLPAPRGRRERRSAGTPAGAERNESPLLPSCVGPWLRSNPAPRDRSASGPPL